MKTNTILPDYINQLQRIEIHIYMHFETYNVVSGESSVQK